MDDRYSIVFDVLLWRNAFFLDIYIRLYYDIVFYKGKNANEIKVIWFQANADAWSAIRK
jgi:hypothetical protein